MLSHLENAISMLAGHILINLVDTELAATRLKDPYIKAHTMNNRLLYGTPSKPKASSAPMAQ